MIRPGRDSSRYDALRASSRSLARSSPWIRFALVSAGFSMFLDQAKSLVSDAQFTWGERQIMAIVGLSYLGSFGLGAWIVGKLLGTAGGLIDAVIDQAEGANRAADLIEQHAVPTLNRIALALEKLEPPATSTAPADQAEAEKSRLFAVARRLIADARWAQADRLVGSFVRDHPGAEAGILLGELEAARRRAIDDLKGRLEGAKVGGDALGVIELRDALTLHLRGRELDDLDRKLARWLVGMVQARVRAGTIRPDVANLAARIVDSFGDTPEGASLRPSIPNLRRAAGLCPRCGQPRRADEDACPRCLAATRQGASAAPIPMSDDPEEDR